MQVAAPMKKKLKAPTRPLNSDNVPATASMLNELGGHLTHRMESRFSALELKIDSGHHELKAELHRVALLVEEQNARNKYVMDGYAQIYDLLVARSSNV